MKAKSVGILFFIMILSSFLFFSCGKSKVTAMLDRYEKIVVKLENMSGADESAFKNLASESEKIVANLKSLEGDETWTAEEKERWLKLTARYAKAAVLRSGEGAGKAVKDGLKKLGL